MDTVTNSTHTRVPTQMHTPNIRGVHSLQLKPQATRSPQQTEHDLLLSQHPEARSVITENTVCLCVCMCVPASVWRDWEGGGSGSQSGGKNGWGTVDGWKPAQNTHLSSDHRQIPTPTDKNIHSLNEFIH